MPFQHQTRATARPGQAVRDPANWTAADLDGDDSWIHVLGERELADLRAAARAALARVGGGAAGLPALTAADFDLGAFAGPLAAIRTALRDGPGLALVRGVPVDRMPQAECAALFWGIGRHLGQAISNNPEGDLIGHVVDTGRSYDDPNVRGYQTAVTMDYHCDQAELVALFCLRTARSGGLSKVASSVAVYNRLLRERPDMVQALMQPLCWTKHGESDPDQCPWYESPVFAFLDGKLCTAFGPKHIEKGHALPGAPPLSPLQREALARAEAIAEELHLAMELQPGDIQILNNAVMLHTRTGFVDWPEPERRRHLWRLWLAAPDIRPATDYILQWRRGVTTAATRQRIAL